MKPSLSGCDSCLCICLFIYLMCSCFWCICVLVSLSCLPQPIWTYFLQSSWHLLGNWFSWIGMINTCQIQNCPPPLQDVTEANELSVWRRTSPVEGMKGEGSAINICLSQIVSRSCVPIPAADCHHGCLKVQDHEHNWISYCCICSFTFLYYFRLFIIAFLLVTLGCSFSQVSVPFSGICTTESQSEKVGRENRENLTSKKLYSFIFFWVLPKLGVEGGPAWLRFEFQCGPRVLKK